MPRGSRAGKDAAGERATLTCEDLSLRLGQELQEKDDRGDAGHPSPEFTCPPSCRRAAASPPISPALAARARRRPRQPEPRCWARRSRRSGGGRRGERAGGSPRAQRRPRPRRAGPAAPPRRGAAPPSPLPRVPRGWVVGWVGAGFLPPPPSYSNPAAHTKISSRQRLKCSISPANRCFLLLPCFQRGWRVNARNCVKRSGAGLGREEKRRSDPLAEPGG